MIVYRIRNRTTGQFFSRHSGYKRGPRSVWLSSAAAKNAWNVAHWTPGGRAEVKFSEQDVWECVPYTLVEAVLS